MLVPIAAGCSRGHYRVRADREVYGLIDCGSTDPRWPLDDFTIEPDPRSRFLDPSPPDCPPMPPDDPTSHQLMQCVDGKRGWPYEDFYGTTSEIDNPRWTEYLPYDEQGIVVLDRQGAVQMALVHSQAYQRQLENLYLSALDVTFQRFRFDTQFFGGNSTFFDVGGPLSGSASGSSTLSTRSPVGATRLFATGGQLMAEVANRVIWQFNGGDGYTAITPLTLTFTQPLLRGAGRAVVLEQLTDSERALLANIRQMERFRRGFYIQTVAGRSPGPGPSPGGIGLGNVSPGGGGGVGGYLSLLEQQLRIRNQRANVAALRDSLERIDAFYEAGRITRRQVDEIRQNLYRSQISLLSQTTNYLDQLDGYKVSLGLPPDLPVEIEDPLLEPFNLLDPALTQTQEEVAQLLDPVRQGWAEIRAAVVAATAAGLATDEAAEAVRLAEAGDHSAAVKRAGSGVDRAEEGAKEVADPQTLEAVEAAKSAVAAARQLEFDVQADEAAKSAQAVRAAQAVAEAAQRVAEAASAARGQVLPKAPGVLATAVDQLEPILQKAELQLQPVQDDCRTLIDSLPQRRQHLRELSSREEFQRGDVDPGVADVGALHRRVVEVYVELLGNRSPYVQQLADELLIEQSDRRWFVQLEEVSGVANDLPDTLAQLEQFRQGASQAAAEAADDLETWRTLLGELRDRLDDLSVQLLGLQLVQARARLDTPTLTPIDLDPAEALRIARANRRDWMNARAALVDQWRQIEVVAKNLESDLNLTFQGDLTTTSQDDPIPTARNNNTTGNLEVGLEFDAPLTRLAERNAYRRTLIAYQQARRQYYAFEDQVSQVLRDTLRSIRLNQLQFELQRAAVDTAIDRVAQVRLELQKPPPPTAEAWTLGATTARDLVTALGSLLTEQNDFLNNWVQYDILRMSLDFDLGTMELDDSGMWIAPGPIQGEGAGWPEVPEEVPPGPEVWPVPEFLPPPGDDDPEQSSMPQDSPVVYQADRRNRALDETRPHQSAE